jgi:ABC-2 type transport system ATP-binding protein
MGRRYVLEIMEKLREHATIFYSTHILDDVQKVSDTVAILNKGMLVAQAPIEELLKGSTSIVYTVVLEGSSDEATKIVQSQDWVTSVEALEKNGRTTLQITVTDEKKAESELLRTLMSIPKIQVYEFGRNNVDLEDVFMKIVEDANNDD